MVHSAIFFRKSSTLREGLAPGAPGAIGGHTHGKCCFGVVMASDRPGRARGAPGVVMPSYRPGRGPKTVFSMGMPSNRPGRARGVPGAGPWAQEDFCLINDLFRPRRAPSLNVPSDCTVCDSKKYFFPKLEEQ